MQPLPGPGRPRVPPLLDPPLLLCRPIRQGEREAEGCDGSQSHYLLLRGLFTSRREEGRKEKERKKEKKREKKKEKKKDRFEFDMMSFMFPIVIY